MLDVYAKFGQISAFLQFFELIVPLIRVIIFLTIVSFAYFLLRILENVDFFFLILGKIENCRIKRTWKRGTRKSENGTSRTRSTCQELRQERRHQDCHFGLQVKKSRYFSINFFVFRLFVKAGKSRNSTFSTIKNFCSFSLIVFFELQKYIKFGNFQKSTKSYVYFFLEKVSN